MISEAALATSSATVGFRSKAAGDVTPELLRKTRLAVARAKEGDEEALRFLYVTYSHNIYGYVRSIVRDEHEAQDITQQVFAKLITAVAKYDDRGYPFLAWLLRMARNAAIDHLRANRLVPTDAVLDPGSGTEADLDQTDTIRAALAALPEEQREVVVLRHVVGLTPREIADRMGRTESAIHGLHHRGRRALQRELTQLGSTPCTRSTKRHQSVVSPRGGGHCRPGRDRTAHVSHDVEISPPTARVRH
jgi:RNA polymerase sigma-70 factor, ECF subfamily